MLELFREAGCTLDSLQEKDFEIYLSELIKWNRVHNLTAVREAGEIVKRHFIDSLLLVEAFEKVKLEWRGKTLADVGSGAGFPGVPLKVYLRDFELSLIESSSKKCSFLESLRLKLSVNYRVICERAERVEEKFHIVVARALGEFEDVAPLLENLSREHVFVMKGERIKPQWTEDMGYRAVEVSNPYYPKGSFILYKNIKDPA